MGEKDRLLIITGNARQFEEYCHEQKISKYDRSVIYVHSEEQLRGLRADNIELVHYGEWWLNPVTKTHGYRYIKSLIKAQEQRKEGEK